MEYYIALCPHFHQPYFQLDETLKSVFRNSYFPWLAFMDRASRIEPSFVMNAHISGPLLQYALLHRHDFIDEMKKQIGRGVVKIVGGLADESFTQLSSRPDDTFYQVGQYEVLTKQAFNLTAAAWDGFHIPERECGENLIMQLTRALPQHGALPLIYLDAETFYYSSSGESPSLTDHEQFFAPSSEYSSRSSVPYFNESALHGIYRDELLGREFFVVPIHGKLRNLLLKRRARQDKEHPVSPEQYMELIQERAFNANRLIRKKSGRDIPPLLLIPVEAEIFGQWSGDPEGDTHWLLDFVGLAKEDPDAHFSTLKGYFSTFGYVDTYPIKTSMSYPEFENWTMRRGIRGVSYVDPQLRRVISVLRELENTQETIEQRVIERVSHAIEKRLGHHVLLERLPEKILNSIRRYEVVSQFLQEFWGEDETKGYEAINRIRNIVYQEDPRWVSRHPSFGSLSYFDLTGMGYCAMAQMLADALLERLTKKEKDKEKTHVVIKDWDKDGNNEAVITNYNQKLVISPKGGTVVYHQMHSPLLKEGKYEDLLSMAIDVLSNLPTFPAIGFYSQCLLHTETDSDLCIQLDGRQSRVERCRDSLRVNVLTLDGTDMVKIGGLDTSMFEITKVSNRGKAVEVELAASQEIALRSETLAFKLVKTFKVEGSSFSWKIAVEKISDPKSPHWSRLLFAPEIVNSITPGDEISGRVESFIGMSEIGKQGTFTADIQQTIIKEGGFEQKTETQAIPYFDSLSYVVFIKSPRYGSFVEEYVYTLSKKTATHLRGLLVTPAVRRFYHGSVFDRSSRLGFHQSGVKIQPVFVLAEGPQTVYEFSMERLIHAFSSYQSQSPLIPLIRYE